ncbi:MAG: hypothetical protein LBI89_00020 [Prevotellaceae bacterium]|jgi:hypothetical protein|nr:hypothetical protein [Prevotellaceae bacterium]
MRNSTLIKALILALGLSSCTPEIMKGFRRTGEATVSVQSVYPFWKPHHTQLFNMKIDFRKNHFSGLLLIKQSDANHYRTVFTTHFGMGIFDFEFAGDTFKVHSCADLLNRKKVLNLLEKDFRTLLFLNVKPHDHAAVYHTPADSSLEIHRINGRYYLKNNDSKTLLKIRAPQRFGSGYYDFARYNNNFPEIMSIKHSAIGLQIELEKISGSPGS